MLNLVPISKGIKAVLGTFGLVTFESLEIEQSYVPLLKALMCGINAVGAQGCGYMFTFYYAPLNIAVLQFAS